MSDLSFQDFCRGVIFVFYITFIRVVTPSVLESVSDVVSNVHSRGTCLGNYDTQDGSRGEQAGHPSPSNHIIISCFSQF